MNTAAARVTIGFVIGAPCFVLSAAKDAEKPIPPPSYRALTREEAKQEASNAREWLRQRRAESTAKTEAILKAAPPVRLPVDPVRSDARPIAPESQKKSA